MNAPDPIGELTLIDRVFTMLESDRQRGQVRSLAEYLRLHPGDDAGVAAAYLAAVAPAVAADSGRTMIADRYVVRREIGRGGQGVVYDAFDTRLKRPVALKTLLRRSRIDDPSRLRFRREAELASRLEDPGICPVYDTGFHEGSPYLAMRLIEGETWARRIADRRRDGAAHWQIGSGSDVGATTEAEGRSPVPAKQEIDAVVELALRTARTLHAAHEAGIVHRDVKPGNIMIGKDEVPVVLDFGLARDDAPDAEMLTATGEALGTPAYMSPEQIRGGVVDRRSDIWSLGVVLFEALALRRPFDGATREALAREIVVQEPPSLRELNPGVSSDLAVVVATAMEKSPERRYATAADLAEDLRRVRAKEPILARPPGPLGRLRRLVERRPALAATISVVVGSLAVGCGIALYALGEKAKTVVEYERLADVKTLRDLRSSAEDLWPAYPALLSSMDEWLGSARDLALSLPKHEADLAGLETALVAESARNDAAALWRRETLRGLVADLRVFADPSPAHGLAAEIETRRASAAAIRRLTIEGDAADLWSAAARAAIGNSPSAAVSTAGPRPRLGLVPFLADPTTGRYEYFAPQTGEQPLLGGPARPEDGVVFVLIPGGEARIGSPGTEIARGDDEDVRTVRMAPFYLAKTETTRAQWRRIMGEIPLPSLPDAPEDPAAQDLLPATERTWTEADRAARRLGFLLPTADQWEYACRAGSLEAYAFGDLAESLAGRANIADASFREAYANSPINAAPFDDGTAGLRSVDAGPGNGYGLKNVHGNAAEWCADTVSEDGRGNPRRVAKGGSYLMTAADARAARLLKFHAEARSAAIGVRFAAALDAPTR